MGRTAFMIHLKNLVIGYEKQPLAKKMNGCFNPVKMNCGHGAQWNREINVIDRTIVKVQKPLEGYIHFPGFKEMTMFLGLPQSAEVDALFRSK